MEEKYEVVHSFKDLQDNDYIYKIGDVYPREGNEPTKKRIKELTSDKNKIGKILIEKIENKTEKADETEKTEETEKEETEKVENKTEE